MTNTNTTVSTTPYWKNNNQINMYNFISNKQLVSLLKNDVSKDRNTIGNNLKNIQNQENNIINILANRGIYYKIEPLPTGDILNQVSKTDYYNKHLMY